MKKTTTLHLALLAALSFASVAKAAPPRYDHVVIVIEENRTYGQIIGDLANAPYITSLANGGVSFDNMFAITHPSQPNYLHLFSGSAQGIVDDSLITTYPFTSANLGAELIAAGFAFRGYSEYLIAVGDAAYDPHTATDPPGTKYRRKHNPWANWQGTGANQIPPVTNNIFANFPADFTTLPTVSFVVPDQNHDMHDGSRKMGDDWLVANLSAYAAWAPAHNSLLVITWDEDDYNLINRIPTVFHGANLKNGRTAAPTWTLHNLLRTLEDMYGTDARSTSTFTHYPNIEDIPAIFDVSADVEAWRTGAANRGWVLNSDSGGTDGWIFKSAETTSDITIRPTLEIACTLPATPFQIWASELGLLAGQNGATADGDRDGPQNSIEFAFNMNPAASDPPLAAGSGTAGLPIARSIGIGAAQRLKLEFIRRKAATGSGVTYEAQFGSDLAGWLTASTPDSIASIDATWERVLIGDPVAGAAQRFGRVRVTLQP